MRHSIVMTAVAGILLMSGCSDEDESPNTSTPPVETTAGGNTGLANPASEFCIEQGGTLEIVDEAGGQVGYCNLPNGDRVEEWEYFRAQGMGS